MTVELCDSQPRFTIHEGVAWDHLQLTDRALKIVRDVDAICFGSLAQRNEDSWNAIQKLVSATRASALRIFDVNLRQHFFSREIIEQSLKLSNVVKLNDAELPVMAELFDIKGSPADQLKKLALRSICVSSRSPGETAEVFCTQWIVGLNIRGCPGRSKTR